MSAPAARDYVNGGDEPIWAFSIGRHRLPISPSTPIGTTIPIARAITSTSTTSNAFNLTVARQRPSGGDVYKDTLIGGAGRDTLQGAAGGDVIDGGANVDVWQADYRSSTTAIKNQFGRGGGYQSGARRHYGRRRCTTLKRLNFYSGSGNDSLSTGKFAYGRLDQQRQWQRFCQCRHRRFGLCERQRRPLISGCSTGRLQRPILPSTRTGMIMLIARVVRSTSTTSNASISPRQRQ